MFKQMIYLLPVILTGLVGGCGRAGNVHTAVGSAEHTGQAQTLPSSEDGGGTVSSVESHAHEPGAHAGNIVPIGKDAYHAEVVFEQGGLLKLYTLGNDESKVLDVEQQSITAYVRTNGAVESEAFLLEAKPQDGDAEGKTSLFLGKLPDSALGGDVSIVIPAIRIKGERYRVSFASAPKDHAAEMPTSSGSEEEERQLYMTAGGAYTEADIIANGNTIASKRFKGFKPAHDLHPKVGEKICPVTLTKANDKCTWIVAGKTYEFCCPPCVEEFVKLAKENPAAIQRPEEYVKK